MGIESRREGVGWCAGRSGSIDDKSVDAAVTSVLSTSESRSGVSRSSEARAAALASSKLVSTGGDGSSTTVVASE